MALHSGQELWKLRNTWYALLTSAPKWLSDWVAEQTDTETKHFIYFYLGHVAILLFKTQ